MADYPLINGLKWDFSSVEIDLAGSPTRVAALTWDESLTPSPVRGNSAQKLARTRGEHDATGTLTLWTEDFYDFIALLGDGYGEAVFDVTCTWSGPGTPTKTTKLLGCRIISKTGGGEAGPDASQVECELDIMQIEEDGKTMVANALL